MSREYTIWTNTMIQRLQDLHAEGVDLGQIARVLKISKGAVFTKLKRSGLIEARPRPSEERRRKYREYNLRRKQKERELEERAARSLESLVSSVFVEVPKPVFAPSSFIRPVSKDRLMAGRA